VSPKVRQSRSADNTYLEDQACQRQADSWCASTEPPCGVPLFLRTDLYSILPIKTLYDLYTSNPHLNGDRVQRVEYARLETATLKDVTDDYYYGCSCQSCLHTARLSLSKLRSHLGADFPLIKIRERLKCQICSSRKVTITFLGPHQKGGNLHHLFDKEAR
jgi:hypothetical protein